MDGLASSLSDLTASSDPTGSGLLEVTLPAGPRPETTEILSSFFMRLESIEEIVRVFMGHARSSTLFTFRGTPEKKVLMDFRRSPARVSVVDGTTPADVLVTVKGDVMHEVLMGRVKPGVAMGRRELLMRGKVIDLTRIIPLFEIAPVLYREHLSDIGCPDGARRTQRIASREDTMTNQVAPGAPIGLVALSRGERLAVKVTNELAYLVGYAVGLLRYRLFKKLNLFEVLSAMAHGLEAAEPTRKATRGPSESGTA
jgi:hypothetical protein